MSNRRTWITTLPRSGKAWLGLAVFVTALAVGCSGGGGAAIVASASDEAPAPVASAPVEAPEPVVRSADAAPDFEIELFETANHQAGEVLRLSDMLGKPVVLNFWYPSCPPCRAEMPDLEQAFQDHRDQGVEFIGVEELILDTVEDGQEFVTEIGVSYALGADVEGDLIAEYAITGFPTTVFIGRDQQIVKKWTGILNAEKIDELIGELLN